LRLRIEYFDHNESFSASLPCEGVVEDKLQFTDSQGPWFLVKLDESLSYQGTNYSSVLLMSRWEGMPIGGEEPTSVFVLLVPQGVTPSPAHSYREFPHVAWAMAVTLNA
jgi:hypothetical protein